MESGVCCAKLAVVEASSAPMKPEGAFRPISSPFRSPSSSISFVSSQGSGKFSVIQSRQGKVRVGSLSHRKAFIAVSSKESSKCGIRSVASPLELRSLAGKFLSKILRNHPHIFHVAVSEQLEQLALDRDSAVSRWEQSLGSAESILHEKIAEMKDFECQIAIEEVMYMLVVQKFSAIGVPMVPRLSDSICNGRLDIWPSQDRELESVHRPDVLELVKDHLANILGCRAKSDDTDNWTTTQMSRLQLGRFYAASILYGYFLKSACLRHHLESNLSLSHLNLMQGHGAQAVLAESQPCSRQSPLAYMDCSSSTISSLYRVGTGRKRTEKLKHYLREFDPETLQRCAKLKSQEAVNIIEKHSWALFGEEDELDGICDERAITVTFSGLKRLILEAVAFGSFLWDVEGYVGSLYRLQEN